MAARSNVARTALRAISASESHSSEPFYRAPHGAGAAGRAAPLAAAALRIVQKQFESLTRPSFSGTLSTETAAGPSRRSKSCTACNAAASVAHQAK